MFALGAAMKDLVQIVKSVLTKHVLVAYKQESYNAGVKIRSHLNASQSVKRREAVASIFVMRSAVDLEHLLLLKIILAN